MNAVEQALAYLKNTDREVTSEIIKDLIEEHAPRAEKMKKMYKEYKAEKLPIQEREFTDKTKINNKINNDYRGEIIDGITGYMYGRPIAYQIEEKHYNETELDNLNIKLRDYEIINDVSDLDNETGKKASICGYAARLLFIDREGNERVINIDPWEVVFVEDGSIRETQFALRYYPVQIRSKDKTVTRTKVEWYDNEKITY